MERKRSARLAFQSSGDSMKQICYASLLFVLFVGAGCSSRPSAAQIEAADCGPKPNEVQLEQLLTSSIKSDLKDPYSAHISFLPIRKTYFDLTSGDLLRTFHPGDYDCYCWEKDAVVNAKNSYGGYTGDQFYSFWMRGDDIFIHSTPDGRLWDSQGRRVN